MYGQNFQLLPQLVAYPLCIRALLRDRISKSYKQ